MEYNCSLIIVHCLDACIALRVVGAVLVWSLSSGVGVNLCSPTANGKQGPIPKVKEVSQTLLTNKKQGNLKSEFQSLNLAD